MSPDSMFTLLQILFPVFGLIGLGLALRLGGFMDRGMENTFNRFCYFVALPAFIFLKAANTTALTAESALAPGALFLVTVGLMAVAWLISLLIRLPLRARGTFLQASFRGNLAYIGLPVLAYALSDQPDEIQAEAETLAILSMAPTIFFYNLLGVMVLEWDRRNEHSGNPLKACMLSTLKNPLILSCALGFSWNVLALPIPAPIHNMAAPIGSSAFPLALLAIGARIAGLNWKKGFLHALALSAVKNGIGLLLGLGVCHLLHLEGIPRLVLLVLSVCPTAVASYVLVDQLNGDRDLAASAIATTTFMSLFALAAALWIGL